MTNSMLNTFIFEYLDENGNAHTLIGEKDLAKCFCHELDHLDGILYTQVMDRFLTEEELEAD